jgi:murein DD-endopeptidase MepM/ murein hydrolase activator NlpD
MMRKRHYILFVARGDEGELRKIPIPVHYLYVFLAGALIGMFSITGMAGSYTRMLMKVARFNQLRTEKQALQKRYKTMEQLAKEKETQAAALSSLADEVSALYGLKNDQQVSMPSADPDVHYAASIDRLHALKTVAMSGAATLNIGMARNRVSSLSDWVRMSSEPNLWPVEGRITSGFAERVDPFLGEGAYHRGVDISTNYGRAVMAPADGVVEFADYQSRYGMLVIVQHANGFSTRYGHLSGFAVIPGQTIHRGDILGYVGMSGRATGPHLHYEVRINDNPVNPYSYLRQSATQMRAFSAGADD